MPLNPANVILLLQSAFKDYKVSEITDEERNLADKIAHSIIESSDLEITVEEGLFIVENVFFRDDIGEGLEDEELDEEEEIYEIEKAGQKSEGAAFFCYF